MKTTREIVAEIRAGCEATHERVNTGGRGLLTCPACRRDYIDSPNVHVAYHREMSLERPHAFFADTFHMHGNALLPKGTGLRTTTNVILSQLWPRFPIEGRDISALPDEAIEVPYRRVIAFVREYPAEVRRAGFPLVDMDRRGGDYWWLDGAAFRFLLELHASDLTPPERLQIVRRLGTTRAEARL